MDLPVEQNLVFKAAQMLQRHAGIKKGARIKLEKDIPSGSGLGGGSSNAAYTLVGLNRLWGLGLSGDELKTIGSSLGSDVFFFFANIAGNPLAITEGRGEVLTPLKINIPFILLLVKPPLSVSTSWAYETIRSKRQLQGVKTELTKIEDKINNIQLIYKLLLTGETRLLGSIIYNDFEDIVIEKHPVIRILKDEILKAGASLSLMSGSGSTVFGIFEDKDRAIKASERLSSYWNRVVETGISS
jgi:4-diphosphocytidyl-2-C-methyl-D-erythritol kinase